MKFHKFFLTAALTGAMATGGVALADDSSSIEALKKLINEQNKKIESLTQKVQDLEQRDQIRTPATAVGSTQRLEQMEQKVQAMEADRKTEQAALEEHRKTTPRLNIGSEGFTLSSADTNFVLRLRGLLQMDSRTFFEDGGLRGNDGFLLRRARPIIQGTVFRDFDFEFAPDFGVGPNGGAAAVPTIFDASLNYTYAPWLQVKAGKFKLPLGLEALQADADTTFNERSFVSQMIPIRDVGIQMHGSVFNGKLSYAGGVFNGMGDNRNSSGSDFDDEKEFAGRIFAQPFKTSKLGYVRGFGFGLGASFTRSFTAAGLPNTTGGVNPGYVTDGQEQFFGYKGTVVASGDHWRLSPQLNYYWGPFSLMGEYIVSSQEVAFTGSRVAKRFDNDAWEVNAGWVLTGENASYNGVIPNHAFDPRDGHWGALQFVARYEEMNMDRAMFSRTAALSYADPSLSARSAEAWSVGLNWYLNKNIRVKGSFTRTTFEGGGGAGVAAPAAVTRQPENVFFTRLQLAF